MRATSSSRGEGDRGMSRGGVSLPWCPTTEYMLAWLYVITIFFQLNLHHARMPARKKTAHNNNNSVPSYPPPHRRVRCILLDTFATAG